MLKHFLWLVTCAVLAQGPGDYAGLRWRNIGPFRAGRTVGVSGVAGQPNVFYMGVNNGGVWRSNDYGVTWKPIFDSQPTGSIGTLAVAPSNPNIIYVASGEGLQRPDLSVGDGIYKTEDAGKTWTHLGLRDGQQVPAIVVDPRNANRLWVAVLGHPYGPNEERGIFKSIDGGRTFRKVLYKDENTGGMDLAMDPKNPDILYAVMWAARQGPWENAAWQGRGSGLFKSTDGGETWKPLAKGLPTFADGLGRIGITVAPSDGSRVYAIVDARAGGIYRSDDAGESFQRVGADARVWSRGSDFAWIRVDPKNKDILYSANIAAYKSVDGGVTFKSWKGAPGGDDIHSLWINPDNPQIILMGVDQGATLTVNGGETWSSWYNQPTAQFYHVITDNQFPYLVCGGQQESGSACVKSRGDHGAISFRDWQPVGVEEYGYVAPDPLNPDLIYGGKLTRFDRRTGQTQEIGPVVGGRGRGGAYRFLRTAPVMFSPVDPHILYYAGNVLFKTATGGQKWDVISPDLSRESYDVPASVGVYTAEAKGQATRRGVIYTIAPSPKDVNLVWAGTDDGLIHVTRDGGKTWQNVTPPELTPWSKVSLMDAGHFDTQTAYAAVNRIRCDDQRPHIYRTHDGGKTWQRIVHGLPDDPINVVREDPIKKGLLFAGSERAVYFSIDDGDNWLPLRQNMPATSIRDLVIHDGDLVVGTHGRSFWILDDMTPLRQMAEARSAQAFLFKPRDAYRVRRNLNTDTPLPPEEPVGENPPDGATIYFQLKTAPNAPVVLEILDAAGTVVRRYASNDPPEYSLAELEKTQVPPIYWNRPPRTLPAVAGMHRWVWDVHYAPPKGARSSLPISAIRGDTPMEPLGPAVMPGVYTARLTVDGRALSQTFRVVMDPRVKTSTADLQRQFDLSMKMYKIGAEGLSIMHVLQSADMPPTSQAEAAALELEKRWLATKK